MPATGGNWADGPDRLHSKTFADIGAGFQDRSSNLTDLRQLASGDGSGHAFGQGIGGEPALNGLSDLAEERGVDADIFDGSD